MALAFQKATKKKAKLRAAFMGPAGSGKTYSSLAVASALGQRIAVIDTEHGSASKYADRFMFDSIEPDSFSADLYIEAIHAAEAAGYDVLVIDSLSHAWSGKDGILEFVDQRTKASRSGNAFSSGWRDATPKHNALIEAILACKCHVIATMRTKTEYVLEEDQRGKKMPRKVGMAPVQRDGMEYEFDVVGDLDAESNFIVTKTRCPALSGKVIPKPGADLAHVLLGWLSDGAEPAKPEAPKTPTPPRTLTIAADRVREAWVRLKAEKGEQAAGMWKSAGASIVGEDGPKPSSQWTADDIQRVENILWPPPPADEPPEAGADTAPADVPF